MTVKAVVFAAGRGTRLGALAEEKPKPLLEVAGRPIIVRVIEGLQRAGVDEITVITGHLAEQIESEMGNGSASGVRLHYVRQVQLDGTARALQLARDWLGDEPFLFSWADILAPAANYAAVVRAARFADGALAVNPVDDPSAGAAVYVDERGHVQRIVEKPKPGTSTTHWNNAGFGVLGPGIWSEVERLQPSERGEYELPRAIAAWIGSGALVRAVPVEGEWFDVGTPEDLARARKSWPH